MGTRKRNFIVGLALVSLIFITKYGVVSASGGFVKRTSSITTTSAISYPIKFKQYLTSAWAKASTYTVTKTVTQTSTVTGTITSEGIEKLKAQFSYGKSTSTSDMIGTIIPANSKQFSKLALKIKYKEQAFKENVKDEYWYTHTGTIYKTYTHTGKYSIPIDKYIYVAYQ